MIKCGSIYDIIYLYEVGMELEKLKSVMHACYDRELCYPKVRKNWCETNKCFGMCAITTLVVQDYFGGDIGKIYVQNVSHYFNIIENKIIDFTASQFNEKVNYSNYEQISRVEILSNENTQLRYKKLKNKVMKYLLLELDNHVYNCHTCSNFVEKFPEDATVFLGKDNDIVLIGEAPANNGWRKSHMLWKDVNGRVLPSGVVLQKLFSIIERDIFETTFLESVKCYPLERKSLKVCSENCKSIMMQQLEILQPKLIISLGEFPTRNLLPFSFKNFSEVVGKVYEVGGYKVLPIYHPSPVSPKSYKGNVPIFEMLKEMKLDE